MNRNNSRTKKRELQFFLFCSEVIMAQQEEGWPLGLQPLNVRAGLIRNGDFSGSISFNTLLTGSPTSSTDSSSSGLDTESTGSFFHDKSITLGSLIGVSSILDLSGKSAKGRRAESLRVKKTSYRSKIWLFSLCSKTGSEKNPPSLGHFLEVERRAANECRRIQSSGVYELNDFVENETDSEPNLLFINGSVAPPSQSIGSPWLGSDVGRRRKSDLAHGNGCGVPVLFSRMCGQSTH